MRGRRGKRWGPPQWASGRGRFFGRGEMRLALLALIVEQPRHGYDLMQELETRSEGVYRPSAGAIYPTLQQLEDEGLLSSHKEGGKNVYTATDAGAAEAERERATVEAVWERAEEWGSWGPASHPAGMEIARHVEGLVKASFRAVGRRGAEPADVREILERARAEIDALADGDPS